MSPGCSAQCQPGVLGEPHPSPPETCNLNGPCQAWNTEVTADSPCVALGAEEVKATGAEGSGRRWGLGCVFRMEGWRREVRTLEGQETGTARETHSIYTRSFRWGLNNITVPWAKGWVHRQEVSPDRTGTKDGEAGNDRIRDAFTEAWLQRARDRGWRTVCGDLQRSVKSRTRVRATGMERGDRWEMAQGKSDNPICQGLQEGTEEQPGLASVLMSCVTLAKLLKCSVPQFPE